MNFPASNKHLIGCFGESLFPDGDSFHYLLCFSIVHIYFQLFLFFVGVWNLLQGLYVYCRLTDLASK